MSATATQIETEIDRLIEGVVGQIEAANIDLDDVGRTPHWYRAATICAGDESYDGCVTVDRDDTVFVWAQGQQRAEARIAGAYEHFAAKL